MKTGQRQIKALMKKLKSEAEARRMVWWQWCYFVCVYSQKKTFCKTDFWHENRDLRDRDKVAKNSGLRFLRYIG